ncbi:MAG: hypothetical protein Q4D93_01345 [Porphyromonas sp.]|nr:hypothetical protein [Porphyromonas sp.]
MKDRICEAYKGEAEELEKLLAFVEKDSSIFPFNEYELLLFSMFSQDGITYDDYMSIRSEYISKNPNLWVFEISAPRKFGEGYGQTLLQSISNNLKIPDKTLDPEYRGEYDLWFDGIKIEVKASRATDRNSKEPLYRKALSSDTKKDFLMNFQQLKPQCCDVFVWIAVYRDCTTIWVMNSEEVRSHPDYSVGQHRGNKGNEGQLHITSKNISTLDKYITQGSDIEVAIKNAAQRKTI